MSLYITINKLSGDAFDYCHAFFEYTKDVYKGFDDYVKNRAVYARHFCHAIDIGFGEAKNGNITFNATTNFKGEPKCLPNLTGEAISTHSQEKLTT